MEDGLRQRPGNVPSTIGTALPGLLRRFRRRNNCGCCLFRRGRKLLNSPTLAHVVQSNASWRSSQSLAGATPEREAIKSWVDCARTRVLQEASVQGIPARQLACTLLGAIVGEGWAAFMQIGDGVIVFNDESGYQLAFWPDNGEYANTTRFLTDEDYREHVRIEIVARHICELAILTDGLQMLALDFSRARVHDPFFAPLFRALRSGQSEETLRASLLEFMDSKRVNDRTDDDKTLLIATRTTFDVPPSLPDATA